MPSLESRPLTYAWRLYAAWYVGYSVFPKTFLPSAAMQTYFFRLFDAGIVICGMGLAGKDICICLSGNALFLSDTVPEDSAGACDYDPAGFIPFPVIVSLYRFFSLKKSLTLSRFPAALAPLAYIRFKRTWVTNPRRFSGSGEQGAGRTLR